jgi:hypothetical protein
MTTNTISKELEIQIVSRWWDKLKYITTGDTPYCFDQRLIVSDMGGQEWENSDCVELVVNVYEEYKRQADEQHKQSLIDKKAKLVAELAEINEELGE